MKIIGKSQEEDYASRLADVQSTKPQPVEVAQNPAGDQPKDIGNGIMVMPGDYYALDGSMVIAASDIGTNGAWRVISP